MASQAHIVMFPFMAQGHMIPMIDIAKLLARHGAAVTVITTENNALRFKESLSRAQLSGLNFLHLEFPWREAGLPEGCDNLDSLPSTTLVDAFHRAVSALEEPAMKLLEKIEPSPDCIVSDMFLPWTINLARNLGVPRISFHGTSCFCLLCVDNCHATKIQETVASDTEYFEIPGFLKDHQVIRATKGQMPENLHNTKNPSLIKAVFDAEDSSYGVIINTFDELEGEYIKGFKKGRGYNRVWSIGPVSMCNKEHLDMAQRGNKSIVNENECLKWLDSMKPRSVVYVCLGSMCNLIAPQLVELGLGLEASNKPFVWVMRGNKGSTNSEKLEKWILEQGFEDRVKGRGLVIRGWAPQVLILSHPSIGGFLTHCGWNSTLEAISSGVPLITWPLFGDQFLNEKLASQVLKIAITLGVEEPMVWGEEEAIGVRVKKECVEEAVKKLLDDEDQESLERRERARKFREMAKIAVEEGGSSYNNITLFLEDIMKIGN